MSTIGLERTGQTTVGSNRDPKNWKEQAATWLFQQGVSTVLLVLILAYGGWMGRYIVDVAIPNHLDSIMNGINKQADTYERSVNKITDEWSKERELVREMLRELQRRHDSQTFIPPEVEAETTGS